MDMTAALTSEFECRRVLARSSCSKKYLRCCKHTTHCAMHGVAPCDVHRSSACGSARYNSNGHPRARLRRMRSCAACFGGQPWVCKHCAVALGGCGWVGGWVGGRFVREYVRSLGCGFAGGCAYVGQQCAQCCRSVTARCAIIVMIMIMIMIMIIITRPCVGAYTGGAPEH